jgi:hypothetical protein
MTDAAKRRESAPPTKVGAVRPSQMVHTYGIGAIVELPHFSVVIPGIDAPLRDHDPWDTRNPNVDGTVVEDRLLEAVRAVLGPTVAELRVPSRMSPPPGVTRPGEWDRIGTWTLPFPRWMRCPNCNKICHYADQLFKLEHNNHRAPNEAKFIHPGCGPGGRDIAVTPVRFVLACEDGHMDDFPWGAWAHRKTGYRCTVADPQTGKPMNSTANLYLLTTGTGQRPTAMKVVCRNHGCDAEAAVQPAFGPDGWKNLPQCGGGRPHLDDRVACERPTSAALASATNLWFSDKRMVLSIPHQTSVVTKVVIDNRETIENNEKNGLFSDLVSFETWATNVISMGMGQWVESEDYTPGELWEEYERQNEAIEADAPEPDVKQPEWVALTQPSPGTSDDFQVDPTTRPPDTAASDLFASTRLISKLRAVSALVGFSRLEAPTDRGGNRASISAGSPRWVPAAVSRGEGLLIRLDEPAVQAWEATYAANGRYADMRAAHDAWRTRRALPPVPAPAPRFVLLHTLSHLLINEISHEAGYAAASIGERIYSQPPGRDGQPMAGMLIYTAAPDAEGTLGGLVALGAPERLGAIVEAALHRAAFCSSDPFCATHRANGLQTTGHVDGDGTVHGAACHVCLFISETSCDHSNRYLDRSVLVDTFDHTTDGGFFTSA